MSSNQIIILSVFLGYLLFNVILRKIEKNYKESPHKIEINLSL